MHIPLKQTFYFFNITNPYEVMLEGAKPNVSQVGPFVYRESRPKYDVLFTPDSTIVEYRYNRTFEYEVGQRLPQTTEVWQFDQEQFAIMWTFELLRKQPGQHASARVLPV